MQTLNKTTKKHLDLPVLLFPGDYKQISDQADGILFLNLVSGRNPEYLIEHQVNAVPILEKTNLEVIPTAYLLIESGVVTAVEKVSLTKPLNRDNIGYVSQTAKASEWMGNKLVYLEAGSGAKKAIPVEMIAETASKIEIPSIMLELEKRGGVAREEMFGTFNMGVGMILVVDADHAEKVLHLLDDAYEIGEITEGSGKIKLSF